MNIQNVLSRVEIEEVCQRDNLRAAWIVACQYAITIGILAVMAIWPNPLTIVLGIVLLGGRQLGFAVIVHECGHGTMFESKKLNDFVGTWLGAAINFEDMHRYARGHLTHHRTAGTREDPDLPNYQDYPISRERLQRKLKRDLSGQTGIKQTRPLFRALFSFNEQSPQRRQIMARGIVVHVLMVGMFYYFDVVWLYAVWWAAFMTSFRAVTRLRQVAEHANVPDLFDLDPRQNTRTIVAPWYDRLLFCPVGVNFHLEHHMMASVPVYNLPKLHNMLKAKGHYDDVEFPANYLNMLKGVTTPG